MSSAAQQAPDQGYRRLVQRRIGTQRGRFNRILIIDDNFADVERCLQEFRRAQFDITAEVIQTPSQFKEKLGQKYFDVVLMDCDVPGWTATHAHTLMHSQGQEIPLILVTRPLETEVVERIMQEGVSDYVDKTQLVRLPLAVALAVERTLLRAEQDRVEHALRHSEAHYRALLENPIYGICSCDLNGRFLEVNNALVTMLGYASREELMAVNLATDIIRDPLERAELFECYRRTGRVDVIEVEWKRKDGSPMKVRLSGRQVGSDKDSPDGCKIIVEDITQQRESEDHFRHLAATDALTGLANYRRLCEEVDGEIKRSDRTGRAFAVLLLDLNGMKQINDTRGHLAGNRALCRLADVFRLSCRSIDTIARYGGDEFAIVLPETTAKDAGLLAQRICKGLADDTGVPALSVSLGIAVYPDDGKTIESLLQTADHALYAMKNLAKNLDLFGQSSEKIKP
jgi:diguanylate cyclase (GGDEF)-like protein/PAS domain S-box-containing protein